MPVFVFGVKGNDIIFLSIPYKLTSYNFKMFPNLYTVTVQKFSRTCLYKNKVTLGCHISLEDKF